MIDAPARRGGDRRLGVKGDAEPGRVQHRQVVGAVADCDTVRRRQTELCCQGQERFALGLAGDDRGGSRCR